DRARNGCRGLLRGHLEDAEAELGDGRAVVEGECWNGHGSSLPRCPQPRPDAHPRRVRVITRPSGILMPRAPLDQSGKLSASDSTKVTVSPPAWHDGRTARSPPLRGRDPAQPTPRSRGESMARAVGIDLEIGRAHV